MEIRPLSSSKWASDTRIGQEELYDATERVLQELKDYKECSGPFLVKVNKREYADYYEVIKNPMDLGTMTKKLKGCEYNSKREIVDDLNLIWANCFTYNVDPTNIYRIMGEKMKAKSDALIPLIPDIVVQVRADPNVPVEEYDEDDSESGEDEPEPEGPTGSRAWGSSSKKATKGMGSKGAKGSGSGGGRSGGEGSGGGERQKKVSWYFVFPETWIES